MTPAPFIEKVLPVIFLVILGLSGMALIFGFSSIRRIPGRRIAGWLSITSTVLVISSPYLDRINEFFVFLPEFIFNIMAPLGFLGFFLPSLTSILILAVTTILLSRAFALVVTTVRPILSWVLTLLLSFGSGVFFVVLFWFSWRAWTGDSRMVLSFVGVVAGFVVICISFCVNFLQKIKCEVESRRIKKTGRNRGAFIKVESR